MAFFPMTTHEKECAVSAVAQRIERCEAERDSQGVEEWRDLMRDIIDAPLLKEYNK